VSVTLLDLRDRATEPPARPDGRILVLDEAEALLKHVEVYQDLISQPTVAGLICVAVGDAGPDALVDGVALAVPAALRPDGERRSAVIWAGDPRGLRWAPHSAPSFAEPGEPALDDLIAALLVEEVFDAALVAVAEMPGAVANPGVRLAYGPADPAAISEAATAAARSLSVPGDGVSRSLATAARQLDAEHDPRGPVLAPPIAARARDAQRSLARTTEMVDTLGTGWALFGRERPTATAGAAMRASAVAAEAYRADLDLLLNDMDGHLEEGRPPMAEVVALGVAEPRPARGPEIAAGLRRLVGERLAHGVTLPDLTHELQAASAVSAPQGVSTLHERVRRVSVPAGEPPPFPRWPLSLWTLPLILLTCLATVALAGPGPDGPAMGLLLALVWTVAGWLLLARRPGPHGERGFGSSAVAALTTYGLSALLGVAAGYVLRQVLTEPPEIPYPMALFPVFALLALVVTARGWRAAARRWSHRLPLAELNTAVTTLDETTAQACLTEWQPMRRRRVVAAVAGAAAGGVEMIRQTLDATGDDLLAAPRHRSSSGADRMPAVALPELFQVVRGDLVDLCRTALHPVWSAAGAAHVSADADVAREFGHLLRNYRAHVVRHGLMSPFSPDADPELRDALMVRAWTGSPPAREALGSRPADRMTQLCDSRQLGFLSTASEPALIRFAPQPLIRVLQRDPTVQRIAEDPQMVWTRSSEFVGAVRLLPLRPESIRYGWDGGER
jgi:hypothetical protein